MPRMRLVQFVAASAALCLAIGLAIAGVAMFRPASLPPDASLWRTFLDDRLSLGFLRLGAIAAGAYLFMSVPALVVAGRWVRAAGPSGFEADAVNRVGEELGAFTGFGEGAFRDLEARLRLLEEDSDG